MACPLPEELKRKLNNGLLLMRTGMWVTIFLSLLHGFILLEYQAFQIALIVALGAGFIMWLGIMLTMRMPMAGGVLGLCFSLPLAVLIGYYLFQGVLVAPLAGLLFGSIFYQGGCLVVIGSYESYLRRNI
ncbi:hypothetical protein [Dehalococcoides mccartyi]|uniref:Uncharacterized protein n=1 Tax=Dehalococcoides mccartyi (strain VS) TaxID=311424 RepID=D2BK19_DEHMV|nr:hypothetical protein [Dehalococcoides mccartyi]ACZ61231.1 hypothetical protein DhcVS_57 [Dehalococcoides mccartyi VS]